LELLLIYSRDDVIYKLKDYFSLKLDRNLNYGNSAPFPQLEGYFNKGTLRPWLEGGRK
jgi:hypothetical protein